MQAFESMRSSAIKEDVMLATLVGGYGLWKGNYYFLGAALNYLIRSITLMHCEDRRDLEPNLEITFAASATLFACAGLSTAEDSSLATAAGYLGAGFTLFNAYCAKQEVDASRERLNSQVPRVLR